MSHVKIYFMQKGLFVNYMAQFRNEQCEAVKMFYFLNSYIPRVMTDVPTYQQIWIC